MGGKAVRTSTGMKLVATDNGQRRDITMKLDGAGNIDGGAESPACMTYRGASCSFNFITAKPVI
ncbi:hypothetical protein [Komagataeibacter sp. FXV3]|uniref:hypothetical protein n=1 Tax=Komagataeibacter sp. FXV3 TaxID=2608998 RepID=UPI00187B1534|nr:hypothetical protein [Komagataeibacter sp. FXV3]MBE7729274.1 hypothetical protein [Komagataeibacter sp. FXV3]